MRILTGLREPVFYFTKVSVAKRKISAGFLSGLEHIELFNHRNRKGKCKMSIPNLPTDFKDDILNTGVNQKRKYQIIYNNDGTVSFEDVTAYSQTGSDFGSSEVNATNGAINNIYDERILNLEDLDLVTEPGYFVDALAVAELNGNINGDVLYENDLKYFTPTISETTYSLLKPVSDYERLLVQSINNNGIKMWTIADTTRGTGVSGTIVEYLFVLTYIVPISAGTSGADPGAWLQSTGFELTNGG